MSTAVAESKKYKFRLLSSAHFDKEGPNGPDGNPTDRTFQVDRKKGIFPIIETKVNLSEMFDQPGYPPKFEPLHEEQKPQVDPQIRQPGETVAVYLGRLNEMTAAIRQRAEAAVKSIDSMSLEDMRTFADDEGIDLKMSKNPDEIRKTIKAALKG